MKIYHFAGSLNEAQVSELLEEYRAPDVGWEVQSITPYLWAEPTGADMPTYYYPMFQVLLVREG